MALMLSQIESDGTEAFQTRVVPMTGTIRGVMDHEAEFAAYADDNWGTLVRSAVFLGCSMADAEDLAQTTLVKCFQAWPRVSAADNRDAYVYTMLINALRDTHRRGGGASGPPRRAGRDLARRAPPRSTPPTPSTARSASSARSTATWWCSATSPT